MHERKDNIRRYGKNLLDWEVACLVVDELSPLLDKEIRSYLSPMAQMWLNEHEGMQDDGQSDSSGSASGQGGLGESQESHISIGPNPDSGVLVEDTE